MARGYKNNADYFPHEAKQGKTLFILKNRYGNDGYAFFFQLIEVLSDSNNHIYDCRNPADWEFLLAYTGVNGVIADGIMETLVNLGKIDRELWENRVIWYQGLVDRLAKLYDRRSGQIPQKHDLCKHLNIKCKHDDDINPINDNKSTHSKVKDSKVKDSKDREETPTSKNPNRKKSSSSLPENFTLSESMIDYAKSKGMTKDIAIDEFEGFILHHKKLDSRFVDWEAAWQTWVRNFFKFGGKSHIPNNGPQHKETYGNSTCSKCQKAPAVVDDLCKACYGVAPMPDDFKETFSHAFKSMDGEKEISDLTLNDRQNDLRQQAMELKEILEDDDIPY